MHAGGMARHRTATSEEPVGRPSVLQLRGFRVGDEISADGRALRVEILMSENEVLRAARVCEFVFGPELDADARARLLVERCGRLLKLGVFLDRSRAHSVRVVRDGVAVTREVRATWRYKWFFLDAFFGPGAFVAWGVDAVSGAWSEFGTLDLDRAFAERVAAR
jgi:hypothetical protein